MCGFFLRYPCYISTISSCAEQESGGLCHAEDGIVGGQNGRTALLHSSTLCIIRRKIFDKIVKFRLLEMLLTTDWGYETSSRKWNRGHNGLHQLGQPVAPSILFPGRRFISPVCTLKSNIFLIAYLSTRSMTNLPIFFRP